MVEKAYLKSHLSKATCSKCGASFESAKLVPLSELPLSFIAHAVCAKCKAESMITLNALGIGVFPLVTDLTGGEFKKFLEFSSISLEEVLELHKKLEDKSICSLLQKTEKN